MKGFVLGLPLNFTSDQKGLPERAFPLWGIPKIRQSRGACWQGRKYRDPEEIGLSPFYFPLLCYRIQPNPYGNFYESYLCIIRIENLGLRVTTFILRNSNHRAIECSLIGIKFSVNSV